MAKNKIKPTNDRVRRMLRGATRAERFIIAAITAEMPDEKIDALMDAFDDKPMDNQEIVAGQAYVNWYGLTRGDLERRGLDKKQIQEIAAAHKSRGVDFGDDESTTDEANTPEDPMTRRPAALNPPGPVPPPDPATHTTTPPATGDAGGGAVTAGIGLDATLPGGDGGGGEHGDGQDSDDDQVIAGRPLSEYDGKSDDEILAMDNVGDKTLDKIRHELKNRDRRRARREAKSNE